MLKEHIVETYGEIRYTMGEGCSGGSMQQHWIAAELPGPARRHPALVQLPRHLGDRCMAAEDCHLLDRVLRPRSRRTCGPTPTTRPRSTGYAAATTCRSLWDDPGRRRRSYARIWLDPRPRGRGCGAGRRESSTTPRPTRAACAARVQDYQVAIFGHARRGRLRQPAVRQRRRAVRPARAGARRRSPPSSSSTSTRTSAASTSTGTTSPERIGRRPGGAGAARTSAGASRTGASSTDVPIIDLPRHAATSRSTPTSTAYVDRARA